MNHVHRCLALVAAAAEKDREGLSLLIDDVPDEQLREVVFSLAGLACISLGHSVPRAEFLPQLRQRLAELAVDGG